MKSSGVFKRAINGGLLKAGYTVIPSWRLPGLPLANHLRDMFKHLSIDCVFDVGANAGGFATFLRHEVGFAGRILSFEPVSELAEACRNHGRQDRLWEIYGYALGEHEGTAEINVAHYSTFSSMLSPSQIGANLFGDKISSGRRETVEVRTLARVLPELRAAYGFDRPYLKIDTQGFDLAVMLGVGDALEWVPALQTEMSVRPIYDGMPSWREVIQYLDDRGFVISGFYPVNLDREFRAVEFDCVFVNDNVVTTKTTT